MQANDTSGKVTGASKMFSVPKRATWEEMPYSSLVEML